MNKKTTKALALGSTAALALFLAACGGGAEPAPAPVAPAPVEVAESPAPAETATAEAGTTRGRGMGLRGYIQIDVDHEDGVITGLTPVFHNDTDDVFQLVFMHIENEVIGHSNLDVVMDDIDMLTGATYTARGVINAIADGLNPGMNVSDLPFQPAYPHIDMATQASPPIYSSFGHINEGSRPATDPLFPVGSTAMLAHEHFPGAAGSIVEITGAFYDPAYAISFQPGAMGFPFEYAHRWIMHSELWGHENVELFQPGDLVMLYTDHFPGSRFVIGVVEYYEVGVTYQMSGHTRYGLPFWDHQWFAESEMVALDSDIANTFFPNSINNEIDLDAVYSHIVGHHAGSHVHGGEGQTYSSATGTDPQQRINSLTDADIEALIDAGFADDRAWRPDYIAR